MIKRYSLPRMAAVWSEENRFRKMLDVELLACEAMSKLNQVPKRAFSKIKKKARFSITRIKEIEAETHHDVIAFLQNIAENVGDDARFIHMGLTSSDALDTGLSVQMREACDILIEDVKNCLRVLRRKALRYKGTLMIGRTHSVHAEPITFGFKLALWYDEMSRNLKRLVDSREVVNVGKISGAVGTYANVDPFVEDFVCRKLGLKPARISTQVVQRDRHAQFLSSIAIAGSSLEKFATEIRNLQHTEIGELEEPFSKGQKGSSAMPHKKNPIVCERICGLARILRANTLAAMENIPLWHERDISHSSVERVILPDSTILLDYMLNKFTDIVSKLAIDEEKMLENLNKTGGIIFSQRVLLELVYKGMTRGEAYNRIQAVAFRASQEGVGFKEALLEDEGIRSVLTRGEIEDIFDYRYHLKKVDRIFKKVGIS